MLWNELEGCRKDVPRLPREFFDEIYAVDGGSSDGSVEYLQSQGIKVYRQPLPGLNAAYVFADSVSTCDAVVVFFPKSTTPPEDLKRFRQYFDSGYQLIIASRQVPGSRNEEDVHFFRPRKWAVRSLAVLIGLLWCRENGWIWDILQGFKGWRRDAFDRMQILDQGLSVDLEMVIRAYKLRLKRVEFPTVEVPRPYGQTHFKFWSTGKKLLAYLLYEISRNK